MSKTGSGLGTREMPILSGDVPAQWFSNVFHKVLGFCKDTSELKPMDGVRGLFQILTLKLPAEQSSLEKGLFRKGNHYFKED